MKQTGWNVRKLDEADGTAKLQAEAIWPRGEIPAIEELREINFRVKKRYPKAEMVDMARSFVPSTDGTPPNKVWWNITWRTFK